MDEDRQRSIAIAIIVAVLVFAFGRGSLSVRLIEGIILIIPAIIFHEVAHGFVAYVRGDDTAKRMGRLTLNPLKHIDLWGTVFLPAILLMAGFPAFGYAKPVPVNVSRLRNQRTDSFIVGFAGPIANLLLAALSVVVVNLAIGMGWPARITGYVYWFGILNIWIAVFNLLPVPPLDGSSIYELFLPEHMRAGYYRFRQYAMIGLIVMLLVFPGLLFSILDTMQKPFRTAYCHGISDISVQARCLQTLGT